MALTQQFARVSPAYLSRCRRTALGSPGGAPGWGPPEEDLLGTDRAVWGLTRHCRAAGADAGLIAALERAVDGDAHEDMGLLDHDEVDDGVDGPPRLLTPDAVTEVARALDAVDLGTVLADLPAAPDDTAEACGFGRGFRGDVRDCLTDHFSAMRRFYREAGRRGWCVVVWVDRGHRDPPGRAAAVTNPIRSA